MLTVDERSFNRERFWGPHTIKPLNFNYEFQPNFQGQNLWTLTDGLFLSDRRRLSDGSDGQEALKVIYSRAQEARKKNSLCYRHFSGIDENVHQKSSPPGRGSPKLKISSSITGKNSRVHSSRGSLSSRVTPPLGASGTIGAVGLHRPQQVFSLTKRDSKSDPKRTSGQKRKSKEVHRKKTTSKTSSQLGFQKANEQKGVPVKLSLDETERLLKSLDFRVRTRKKVTTRERSKSERVRKSAFAPTKMSPPASKMPFQKRGIVGSPTKKEKPGMKRGKSPGKKETMVPRTSQNQLVRSSRKTSWQTSSSDSSRKMSTTSTSGLGDLLGPLPRVKWTPEGRTPKERSTRKKTSSEKATVTLMKGNKMKAAVKKVEDRDSPESQDQSEVEGSSREAVVVRKVRTTPTKIIPKVTINNQLLKSTTNKNEKTQDKKAEKAPLKTGLGKKKMAASASSVNSPLWTPENVALLDQITSDQQLKAVLMSAGDTYMKSRKYLSFKLNPPHVKIPVKVAQKKKELTAEDQKTGIPSKSGETGKTQSKPSGGTDKAGGSGVKDGIAPSAVVVLDHPSEATQTGDGPDEKTGDKAKKTVKKSAAKLKNEFGVKAGKATVVVKSKTAKVTAKAGAAVHLATAKKDVSNGVKRRPKFVTTASKAKERFTQLNSEASGPSRVQSERMAQIHRSNLDTLKKILDKSLSASNKPARPEEVKGAQAT